VRHNTVRPIQGGNLVRFEDLGLSRQVLAAIQDMGFEETTPIQEQAIPLGLMGRDIIGQAQTGTGKTAAFGLPIVEKADSNQSHVQGLVIAPTRELAVQVAEELNRIGRNKGIQTVPIYGGQDIVRQIRALKSRPQVIVGTPGRLMDHMRRKTLRLEHISTVVLDEADEMLNMGFLEDIETILKEVPENRQTMLFSATMPEAIRTLAGQFMKNPEHITVKTRELTVPSVEQCYIEVHEGQKFDVLCRLLDMEASQLAIVFGRTKRRVDELTSALSTRGYSVEGIHGDLTQAKRDSVMRKFRAGTIDVLVATDVAARGLDITNITHVFNFDIPQDAEWYVHRIGRTGRIGKSGMAVTFVTPREIEHLHYLESIIKTRISRRPLPTLAEAMEGQIRSVADNMHRAIQDGQLEPYRSWAERLLADTDSITLLSAALKIMSREPDTTPVQLTEEKPTRVRRPPHRRHVGSDQKKPFKGKTREHKSNNSDRPRQKDSRWS
jgi:ATP-dependent RNA helicase DeaD